MARLRDHPLPEPPARVDSHDGLAYALFLPGDDPIAGVVILHGAGSAKESHYDFARAARSLGMAAIAFDQRGHGDSPGPLGAGALDDVATIAGLLPDGPGGSRLPLVLRGSSMGGYLALVAAEPLGAAAVVAICPAGSEGLLRGLRAGELEFEADVSALEGFLIEHDLDTALPGLTCPLLLMHAEGDEQIPVEHSRHVLELAGSERKRLIAVPGGHHRSVQHDLELQGESLRFVRRALA